MSEIYLNPEKFQSQIDSFEKGAGNIESLEYSLSENGVSLRSIDKYKECVTEINAAIDLFAQMLDQDTTSMKKIKATWMNADSDIATMTAKEAVIDSVYTMLGN